MGQMTTMWGHELNQPLTACGNYLKGMLRIVRSEQTPKGVRLTNAVAQSLAQLDRAQAIIQRLKDLVRKGEPTASPELVSELFDEAAILLGMKSEGLTIKTQVEVGLPPVLVDKIQIEQVLINLMRNAVEAMQHSNDRSIILSAKRRSDMALISVCDSGPGIPKAVSDKLFQSFNTTKINGMGVGLSICRTLIIANGGQIWAESNPGGGATFCFTLPILPPTSDSDGRRDEIENHELGEQPRHDLTASLPHPPNDTV
jgi:two-component system sensor kinase FixL